MQNRAEFYAKLKEQLEQDRKWPAEYMYKFIVPMLGDSATMVEDIFDNIGAVITTRPSKTGKYVSLTIRVVMNSPDDIIAKYHACESVPGIISL